MKGEGEIYVLVAPCGDAIEVWEPIPALTSWCAECNEWQLYLPE